MQTTLYKKPTDCPNYLDAKPAHTKKEYSLQPSINNKTYLLNFREYQKHSNDLVKQFVQKRYKEDIIRNQIEKIDNLERSTLLNKTNAVQKNVIPFPVTYSPTLPNIREVISKHCHILNIKNIFGNVVKATPAIAFRKNTSLRQIIGTSTISHN